MFFLCSHVTNGCEQPDSLHFTGCAILLPNTLNQVMGGRPCRTTNFRGSSC